MSITSNILNNDSNNPDLKTESNNIHSQEPKNEDKVRLTLDDFEIFEPLGNGKFGYVYRSKFKNTNNMKINNKELAIKLISKNIVAQYNFFDQLENEITIQSRLK